MGMIYKWGVYNFTDKEIDQIVSLVEKWGAGSIAPIGQRGVSRQVVKYAECWDLIELAENAKDKWDWQTSKYKRPVYMQRPNRYYISSDLHKFDPRFYLPQEALWRFIKPMLEKSHGFAVTKSRRWNLLGIWPSDGKQCRMADIEAMMHIFGELAKWGYIIFQSAGDIWQITETPDRAARSEL